MEDMVLTFASLIGFLALTLAWIVLPTGEKREARPPLSAAAPRLASAAD